MTRDSVFIPVYGRIVAIEQRDQCCEQFVSLKTDIGPINLIVTAETYVVNQVQLRRGMQIVGFYDGNAPAVLIFPPQYRAVVVTAMPANRSQVAFGYFDERLLAGDGSLQLNVSPATPVVTANGQRFPCSPGGNFLIVYYGATTRSIPPQTSPSRIIVLCGE